MLSACVRVARARVSPGPNRTHRKGSSPRSPRCQEGARPAARCRWDRTKPKQRSRKHSKFPVTGKRPSRGHLSFQAGGRVAPPGRGTARGTFCRAHDRCPPNVRKTRGGRPAPRRVSHGGSREAPGPGASSRGAPPPLPQTARLRPAGHAEAQNEGRWPLTPPLQWGSGGRAAPHTLGPRAASSGEPFPYKDAAYPCPAPTVPAAAPLEPRQPRDSQVGPSQGVPVSPAFQPFPGETEPWTPATCPGRGCPARPGGRWAQLLSSASVT